MLWSIGQASTIEQRSQHSMGPSLSTVEKLADRQPPDEAVTWQTQHADNDAVCDACSLRTLEAATHPAAYRRLTTTQLPASRSKRMECPRRGSVDFTQTRFDRPSTLPSHRSTVALEEYKQTADRILKDFAMFTWPREVAEGDDNDVGGGSTCPSLTVSENDVEASSFPPQPKSEDVLTGTPRTRTCTQMQQYNQPLQEERDNPEMTMEELKDSAPVAGMKSIDPWLMQHLRDAEGRWSGTSPGHMHGRYAAAPHSNSKSALIHITGTWNARFAEENENENENAANNLIEALDHAFQPTFQRARRPDDDTHSDVSELDLTESHSADCRTSLSGTCDEVAVEKRRHSLAAPGVTSTRKGGGGSASAAATWALRLGAMTASI